MSESLIRAYFDACTAGDAERVAACFTDDAVIYDTCVRPLRGAVEIGRFWQMIHGKWRGATWTVDSCVESGQAAAIEWTMTGTNPRTDAPFAVRGSEHYRFVDGLIDEIRQYWTFDPADPGSELLEFPYADRNHLSA